MADPSLDRATAAVGELATIVRSLTVEVKASEDLRSRKIKAIQHMFYVVSGCIALLLLMAGTNFVLLNRVQDAAVSAKDTNDLLVSCFQPGTPCSATSAQRTGAALEQLRQTQFVIAICQRQNPVDVDPNGVRVIACVQRYYPTFTLPPQAGAKPRGQAKPPAPLKPAPPAAKPLKPAAPKATPLKPAPRPSASQ